MTEPLSKTKFLVPKELARYIGRDVSREAKMLAARGSVPLPPVHLSIALFFLGNIGDDEMKAAANGTLLGLPEGIRKTIVEAPDSHPMIIDFLVRPLEPESPLLESAALNKVTHDETIEYLAAIPIKRLVDIIGQNQIRIIRHPPIVDVLGNNPMTSQALIRRLVQFLALQTGAITKEEAKKQRTTFVSDPDMAKEEEYYTDEDMMDMEVTLPEGFESPWADSSDLPSEFMEESEGEMSEDETLNMSAKIADMSISQKIKAAMMGNKEARGILVRDTNKIISSTALNSPRITDGEIEVFSKSRGMSDDIIRQIANNREWTRNYMVKVNLVNNSKTPFQTALKFLNFLTNRDLTQAARSKMIPSSVAGSAKKLISKRRERKK